MTWKEDWEDFKKDLTWNNIKIVISAGIPMIIGAVIFIKWINILTPIMNNYTSSLGTPVTIDQAVISLCLIMGIIFPLWPLFLWSSSGGMLLGKALKFFKDDKTRRIWWDDKWYSVRDMPEDERKKIESILTPYKSKVQLRKESKANQSWLRRNFT